MLINQPVEMSEVGSESDYSDSTSISSAKSYSSSSDEINEVVKVNETTFRLPKKLCENQQIFNEFFSMNTWRDLPENFQVYLKNKFLPHFPENNENEKEATLNMLFNNELRCFGISPLASFRKLLEEGAYRPDVLKLRVNIVRARRREQRFQECERISRLSRTLALSREKLLSITYNAPPGAVLASHRVPRALINCKQNHAAFRANRRFIEEICQISQKAGLEDKPDCDTSDIGEALKVSHDIQINSNNEHKVLGTMCKKNGLKRSLTFEATINNDNLHDILLAHKKRKLQEPERPEYETNDIRLRDVHARTQLSGNYKRLTSKAISRKSSKGGHEKNDTTNLVPETKLQENQPKYEEELRNVEIQKSNEATMKKENLVKNSSPATYFAERTALSNSMQSNSENKKRSKAISVCLKANKPIANADFVNFSDKILQKNEVNEIPSMISDISNNVIKEYRDASSNSIICNAESVDSKCTQNDSPQISHQEQLNEPSKTQNTANDLELTQDTHVCFFSLIRDIFCSTSNHRIHLKDLKEKVCTWLSNPITALNDWYNHAANWLSLIDSAIHFLAGDFSEQPSDFVPYLEFKVQLDIYQWIGAGRDSDQLLLQLYNYWLARRFEMDKKPSKKHDDSFGPSVDIEEILLDEKLFTPPPPKCPTQWTVQPYTPEEILEFRVQEKKRFENPHRAFTYRMHGYESVVGPVKGIYTQMFALTKARGHNMLIADRPNFVTILTLVRDATARLPNGEGTRADICELLKSSQYINPQAQDSILQTIVSGALDRMHTEHDPCVRYDPKRKIWIYLHRNRTEEEFEIFHQQHQGVGKLKKSANRKIKQKFPKLASSEDSLIVSAANNSFVTKLLPTLSSIHPTISQTLVTSNTTLTTSKITSKSQIKPELVPIKSNAIISEKRPPSEGVTSSATSSSPAYQTLPTLIVDSSLQKFATKKASTLQINNSNMAIGNIAADGTVLQKSPLLLSNINTDGKQISITIPSTAKSVNYQSPTPDRKAIKSIPINENPLPETASKGTHGSPDVSNSLSFDTIDELSVKSLSNSQNLTTKIFKPNQTIIQTTNSLKHVSLPASAKNLLRVSASTSQAGKSLISPHIAATNISLQHQKIHSNINLPNVSVQQNMCQTNFANLTNYRPQHKTTIVNSMIRTNQLSAFQQKQRQKTINLQNAVMISSNQVVQGELQGKQVIIPQQGNMQKQKTIICTGNSPSVSTTTSLSSPVCSSGSTINSTLMTPQIIRIQQAIPYTGSRLQTISTTNSPIQDDKILQAAKKQPKIHPQHATSQQSVVIKKQGTLHQVQKQTCLTTSTNVPCTSVTSSTAKVSTPVLSTTVKDNSSAMINSNISHQTLTQVKQEGGAGQQILEKPTQTVTRIIKPGGSIIHSLASVSGIRTQVGNPLLTKVITNNPAQIVSLESLLQKQGVNSTLRLAGCKTNQSNMLQLAPQSSQLPQYTVVSQGRNIISVSSAQRMAPTSAAGTGNILTSLSSISSGKVNDHVLTTQNSTISQSQAQNVSKIRTNQIHTMNSPQLVNTKVLGKTASGSIRMVNASNLNIAHIRGKPVIIASKPTNLTGQQSTQGVLLPNPINSGNVVIGAQTLKLQGNIITPANVQVLSQSASTQSQTVVLGNQIIKVQQTLPIKSHAATPVTGIITSTLNSTRVSAQPVSLATAITGGNHGENSSSIASLGSKTVVLGSAGQTFRVQPTTHVNAQTVCSTSQAQQMFISSALKGANMKTSTNGQQRVVLAVQGGGQILLPTGFQGGAINLKSVQGIKVISVTQQNKDGPN